MMPKTDEDWLLFSMGMYFLASGIMQLIALVVRIRMDRQRKAQRENE